VAAIQRTMTSRVQIAFSPAPRPPLHPPHIFFLGSRTSSSGAAAVSDRRQLEMAVPPRTFLYGSPPRPGRWRSIVGPRSPRSDQSGAARQRHGLSGQGHVAGYRRAKLGARSGAPVIAAGAAGQGMRQAGRPAAAGGERGVATGQAASVRMHAPPMFRCWIFPVRSLARREIR
jgi:hypothetical protein